MNKMFIIRKCKKCRFSVFQGAGKYPDHCGLNALPLEEVKSCKKNKI